MVGLTQRVDVVAGHGERRDALDQAWAQLVAEVGFAPAPIPNTGTSADQLFKRLALSALVLTGGNDLGSAPERDALESALLREAAERELPVLAVCRGFQLINTELGGDVAPVTNHVATAHDVLGPDGTAWANVNSFHNFGVPASGLASDLEPLLKAPDGTIEAAIHRHYPWLCVMWHPERTNGSDRLQRELVRRALSGERQLPAANF